MKLPSDYADRSGLLGTIEDLEDHWHKESADAKIGKIAALVVVTCLGLILSFVYSKSEPDFQAPNKIAHLGSSQEYNLPK